MIGGNALNGPLVSAPSEPAPVVEGDLPVMLQMNSMNSSGNSMIMNRIVNGERADAAAVRADYCGGPAARRPPACSTGSFMRQPPVQARGHFREIRVARVDAGPDGVCR